MFITQGIYVGSVGARFERPGLMEWAHMCVTAEQNTPENGYGLSARDDHSKTKLLRIWANFYGMSEFPSYDEVLALEESDKVAFDARYQVMQGGSSSHRRLFDKLVYKQRMRMVTTHTHLLP